MSNINTIGKIFFTGAGPGDPELITLKAIRQLAVADLVIVDRLVSKEILTEYVPSTTEIIFVGKQAGKDSSTSQKEINDLLVKYALLGKQLVRLKGGDVSVFSNILDELEAASSNGIPFEIIPGITAASGAAAYSGIPLTARGYASGVQFISYNQTSTWEPSYWKTLATTNDTLVFYMSSASVREIALNVINAGSGSNKLLAIIEDATTPSQNVTVRSVYEILEEASDRTYKSPCLLIIGRVVELYEKYRWLDNKNVDEHYFRELSAISYQQSAKV